MTSNKTLIIADSASWLDFALSYLSGTGYDLGRDVDLGISAKFWGDPGSKERMAVEQYLQRGAPVKLWAYDVSMPDLATSGGYTAILSLHCQQLFCAGLTQAVPCFNIHPGYLPAGRGWAPVSFARMTGGPVGATLHVIDAKVDHGAIIDRSRVQYRVEDNCADIWPLVRIAEKDLLKRWFHHIHRGEVHAKKFQRSLPHIQEPHGVVRSRAEYEALLKLDMNERMTMGQAINRLAALSLGLEDAKLHFEDREGNLVYVNLELRRG